MQILIDAKTAERQILIAYRFLCCGALYRRRATIFDKAAPGLYHPVLARSEDLTAACYSERDLPVFEHFAAVCRANDNLISCVAGFDEKNRRRVNLVVIPGGYDPADPNYAMYLNCADHPTENEMGRLYRHLIIGED